MGQGPDHARVGRGPGPQAHTRQAVPSAGGRALGILRGGGGASKKIKVKEIRRPTGDSRSARTLEPAAPRVQTVGRPGKAGSRQQRAHPGARQSAVFVTPAVVPPNPPACSSPADSGQTAGPTRAGRQVCLRPTPTRGHNIPSDLGRQAFVQCKKLARVDGGTTSCRSFQSGKGGTGGGSARSRRAQAPGRPAPPIRDSVYRWTELPTVSRLVRPSQCVGSLA